MARARGALTEDDIAKAIDACATEGKRAELSDGVNGLVVAITAKGHATWWTRYRDAQGRQRRYKLGVYPGLSLAKARTKSRAAKNAGESADKGEDPAEKKARQRREGKAIDRSITVAAFGTDWTSGKLFERYGTAGKLKAKRSADDDRKRLELHVYPYIGKRPVAEVTLEEIELSIRKAKAAAKRRLGRPWRSGTEFQVYQVMRRLFELAIYPAKLRTENPVHKGLRPSTKIKDKLFGFLYPDELAALVMCDAVPPGRRVLYALAVYTGLRLGSLLSLTWANLDTAHGTMTVLDTKTDVPQIFAIRDPALPGLGSVLGLLDAWREICDHTAKGDPIVARADIGCKREHEAKTLRDDLRSAGIERVELFGDEENDKVQPLRFHDLRATFTTWALRAGKGKGWISDRTGHLTEAMMNRYARGARHLRDLEYEPFPDIAHALDPAGANVVRMRAAE